MILPSKPAQYALRALCFIATRGVGEVCQAELISRSENIPGPYLAKVLKELAENKILKSIKGPGGGFTLNRSPEKISIYEVVAVFDNIEDEFKCCAIGWKKCSDSDPCPLHHEFKKVKDAFSAHLHDTSLSIFEAAKQVKETV